jgi:hypothetical protein
MRMRRILILLTAVAALTAAPFGTSLASSSTTYVVTPAILQGWQIQTDTTQAVTFVEGPATPPLPTGSAQMSVGADGDGAAQLRQTGFAGTKLADLTALGYSTYVQQNNGGQATYIMLNVDRDGDGAADDLLFFEPVYQDSTFFPSNPQPSVALNQWQTWDALDGGWYGIDANGFFPTFAGPGTGVQPLSDYVAANPNAKIVNSSTGRGGVRLVAGFGAGAWDNFVGNVDDFRIGVNNAESVYNFELHSAPTSAAQCKKDGWQGFNPNRAAGPFKNQGDCIQYVNTGK